MGIRFQPPVVDIQPGNPFENDLLDREEMAEILTRVVGNVDGPCVIAVDASWGAGKTTFLRMWGQLLRDNSFPVAEFNAWETDYSGEPFVPLTSEITGAIQNWSGPSVNPQLDAAKHKSLEILQKAAPGVIRAAASFIPFVGGEVGNVLSSLAEEKIKGYQQAQLSISSFKSELQNLANTLWESAGHKPLVVLIDELDRCRPLYAIELLETGKHIFSVNRIVFVIAVNRSELAKSAKVLYGNGFGADAYLRRFFDVEIRLPEPERNDFIQHMLGSGGFYEYLDRTSDESAKRSSGLVLTILQRFLGGSEISLREVGQAIHRFGLVLSSLADRERAYSLTLAVLTILIAVDPFLYRRFADGEMNDQEVVEAFFNKPGYESMRRTPSGYAVESVLVAAGVNERNLLHLPEDLATIAPLYWHYHQMTRSIAGTIAGSSPELQHALEITDAVMNLHGLRSSRGEALGFEESTKRLELLSTNLLGD